MSAAYTDTPPLVLLTATSTPASKLPRDKNTYVHVIPLHANAIWQVYSKPEIVWDSFTSTVHLRFQNQPWTICRILPIKSSQQTSAGKECYVQISNTLQTSPNSLAHQILILLDTKYIKISSFLPQFPDELSKASKRSQVAPGSFHPSTFGTPEAAKLKQTWVQKSQVLEFKVPSDSNRRGWLQQLPAFVNKLTKSEFWWAKSIAWRRCDVQPVRWFGSHVGPGLPHSDWGSYKKFQKVMQPLETSWHNISQLQLLKSASFPHHIKTHRHQSNGNASCHKLTENTHEHDWTCINMSQGANIKINILNESP